MKTGQSPLSLSRIIGIKKGDVVSLVGGGGKTSTMYLIADELAGQGRRIIITTTTHIFPPDSQYKLILTKNINEVEKALQTEDIIVLADSFENEKLKGIDPRWVEDLKKIADNIIIEADGARNLPFKAPKENEPVIPSSSTVVVPIVGVDAAHKPLSSEWSHRTDRISALTGINQGDTVTPEIIAETILHPMGGMKGVPENALFIPLINKADTFKETGIAREIAACFSNGGVKKTIITSHRREPVFIKPVVPEKYVSAVILAAGDSRRMGKPKLELEIDGLNLVDRTIGNTVSSIVDEIILVTKPGNLPVDVSKYPQLKIVENEKWETGQSSSMKAGLNEISPESDSALFLMADQPMVFTNIINELVISFLVTGKPITAPLYNKRKGAPVLFDKSMFQELLKIEGDKGGRDLLDKYPVNYVEIDSSWASFDVDTPEDFKKLKEWMENGC
ncbi:selenium cofactor biosynthesis protein YqeC [Thermodesulfobacteriota bacterium]